ncbi:MAG: 50S ribosomal protein L6 [Lysobacterales bacterium]
MSRIAKKPVTLPKGVDVTVSGQTVTFKGPKGSTSMNLHSSVSVEQSDGELTMVPANDGAVAMAGTMRALLHNCVIGATEGFERKLELVGVGYRAAMQGKTINLTLGFSHPVEFTPPEGVTLETPSQTEVVIKGTDKQQVGQVAAVIRGYRPPEPYKGKGVRYAGERIVMKEAKKA